MILATARLAPIDKLIPINTSGPITDVIYDPYCFTSQIDRPLDLPLLLDHNDRQRVGTVRRLFRKAGWWTCEFSVDRHRTLGCYAEDILRVGSAVSLSCKPLMEVQPGLLDSARVTRMAVFLEVSLASTGRTAGIAGAEVTAIHQRETPRRQPIASPTDAAHKPQRIYRECGVILDVR